MNFFKKSTAWPKGSLALLAIFTCSSVFSQTLSKYVPSDAPFVFSMNLRGLDKKVDLARLQQFDFYNELVKSYSMQGKDEEEQAYFKEFLYAPSNLGYDALEPFYLFVKQEGDQAFLTWVMKLADRPKYEESLKNLKKEGYNANLQTKEGYLLWQDENNTYAWNDEVVVNVWGFQIPGLGDNDSGLDLGDEEYPEEGIELEPIEMDTMVFEEPEEEVEENRDFEEDLDWGPLEKQAATAAWVDKVMRRSFLQPVSASPVYGMARANSFDAHCWVDYGYLVETFSRQSGMANVGGMQQYLAMAQAFMEIFYADTYFSMGLDFKNGQMALQSEVFFNEEMKKLYQGMLDVKFNKKFLRYVKGGDQLFGYVYVNYNIKKTIEEGKGLLYKLAEATPGYGEMAADVMKILGIFIDEDAIGNLLKGDMLLAVSGLQSSPVTTQVYGMDEEFNMVAKDTTILKTTPIVTALLSYGNEKDIMKFINLGLHSKALTQEGRYYRLSNPGAGVEAYLALRDGVLLFTNNKEAVTSRLENGYARPQRLDKKHRKLLCDNAAVMFWDIPNTVKAAAGTAIPAGDIDTGAYLEMVGRELESLQITGDKKVGNSVKGRLDFNFVNKNVNALEQFFRFINNIYLEFAGVGKT